MMQIPLEVLPNQSLTTILDDNRWLIDIVETVGAMAVTLTLNDVVLVSGVRAVANTPIIASEYQESGNFLFATQNFDMPYYDQFGVTQYLYYFSAAEIAVIREPVTPPITQSYFDPIAELPLRFAPQGY